MPEQDEVTGLRDIIRHDVMMDARAIDKINRFRATLDSGVIDLNAIIPEIRLHLDEIEKCITSTLSDASKTAGAISSIQLVLADRPE